MYHLSSRLVAGMLGLLLVVGLSDLSMADVILLEDGRRFEGTISEDSTAPDTVKIDAMVHGIRVKLTLRKSQIKSMERKALAAGFYDTKPKEDKRVSDAGKFAPGTDLYLEVPIVGRFGVQVIPQGVQRCLSYAVRHGIKHIVFVVDSQGGDRVAASEIYRMLAKQDDRLTYHALVRDSVGVAMAVTVWCDNVFLRPGANLGGVVLDKSDQFDGDPTVIASQIAYEADVVASGRGWPSSVVRAMIDPEVKLAAWRDASGSVLTGARVPEGVSRDRVVFQDNGDDVLTLRSGDAVAIGVARAFRGKSEDLAGELESSTWTKESDFGIETMIAAAREHQTRMARADARAHAKVAKLVRRREQTKIALERNLELAHEWDPARATYSSYDSAATRDSWISSWGPTTGPEMNDEEKRKWRHLSDITLTALTRARKAAIDMEKLEYKADELGVDRIYDEAKLAHQIEDLTLKINMVADARNRRFK